MEEKPISQQQRVSAVRPNFAQKQQEEKLPQPEPKKEEGIHAQSKGEEKKEGNNAPKKTEPEPHQKEAEKPIKKEEAVPLDKTEVKIVDANDPVIEEEGKEDPVVPDEAAPNKTPDFDKDYESREKLLEEAIEHKAKGNEIFAGKKSNEDFDCF